MARTPILTTTITNPDGTVTRGLSYERVTLALKRRDPFQIEGTRRYGDFGPVIC